MATIAIIVLALLVFAGLLVFNVMTKTIISSIEDKIDVSVYFKNTTAEDDILRIRTTLQGLPEVKNVDYVSKDEALAIFKEKHANDPTISQAIEQLNENPLLASLNIKARNPDEYPAISKYLDNDSISPFIEKVSYAQNASVIDRLNRIINTATKGGWGLTAFVSLIAILITFNTIRLAIYSNRESINIMRLVGGSNFFIRGPFLVEGILYGIISAVVSLLLLAPIIYFVSPYANAVVPELYLWSYFVSNLAVLFVYQVLFGVGLGIVSSFIAIGKYLKD
jgi:cell division transport system permease protein